jgi:hypothetical protein
MIKLRTQVKGKTLIGFGLSFHNIALLQQGRPIHVRGVELGVDYDFVIFAGETEEAMQTELRDAGLLPPL